jgi:hypothetical protein
VSTIKVNNIKTRSGTAITVGEASTTTTAPGNLTVSGTVTATTGSGIGNNALTNNSITVNGVTIALGASGTIPVVDTFPTITSASTIAPAGGTTTIVGTNFTAQSSVELFSSTGVITEASQVAFTSSTSIAATIPATASGNYFVRVTNNDGGTGTSGTALLLISDGPSWQTAIGNVGSAAKATAWSTITLTATGDNPITYTEAPGTANALSVMGLSLANSANTAVLTGTATSPATTTSYNFTIRATDNDSQSTDRTFSVTITTALQGGTQFN